MKTEEPLDFAKSKVGSGRAFFSSATLVVTL